MNNETSIQSTPDFFKISKTIGKTLASNLSSQQRTEAILTQMQEAKLLSIVVPKELGGANLSLRDAAKIVFNISKTSASVGLIYAMHLSQILCLVRHTENSTFLTECLKKLTAQQGLVASVASETAVGGDIFGSRCTIMTKKDKLFLEKSTPNISYANTASAFLITALDTRGKRPVQRLIYTDAEQTGLKVLHENIFLGMQGIVNRSYEVSATFSQSSIFQATFPIIARETMTPATHLLWSAVWSGIAAHALDIAQCFVGKELKNDSLTQKTMALKLSTLVNMHHTMNALIRDALYTWESEDKSALGFAAAAQFNRLKVLCSETVNDICYQALVICGLRGYAENGPYSLSEIIRDALSAPLMVSNHRLIHNTVTIEKFVEESP